MGDGTGVRSGTRGSGRPRCWRFRRPCVASRTLNLGRGWPGMPSHLQYDSPTLVCRWAARDLCLAPYPRRLLPPWPGAPVRPRGAQALHALRVRPRPQAHPLALRSTRIRILPSRTTYSASGARVPTGNSSSSSRRAPRPWATWGSDSRMTWRATGCIRIALLLVLLRENGIGRLNLFGGFIGDWRVDCVQ